MKNYTISEFCDPAMTFFSLQILQVSTALDPLNLQFTNVLLKKNLKILALQFATLHLRFQ